MSFYTKGGMYVEGETGTEMVWPIKPTDALVKETFKGIEYLARKGELIIKIDKEVVPHATN